MCHLRQSSHPGGKQRLAALQCVAATQLLESLGFLVNYSKSQTLPTHELTFLGLPNQKLSQIWNQARKMLKQTLVSARETAQFVEKLSATVLVISSAPFHYQSLQHLKLRGSQNFSVSSTFPAAREDLRWWLEPSQGLYVE